MSDEAEHKYFPKMNFERTLFKRCSFIKKKMKNQKLYVREEHLAAQKKILESRRQRILGNYL